MTSLNRYNPFFQFNIFCYVSIQTSVAWILTEMGMLDCADRCCHVTNRFSIFICFSSSVSTRKKLLHSLFGGD